MSYFQYERIAEGYANSRPHFQPLVMEMLKKEFDIKEEMEYGLDVGCGAGSSTTALRKICRNVTGADESEAMIRAAVRKNSSDSRISYIQCSAEQLHFEDNSFDIITACGSINWIDEKIFLPAAHKMLKNQGILLIYDNYITDKMEGNEAYTKWWYEGYLKHFPKPPRKENVWKNEEVHPYGFIIRRQEMYTNPVLMTKEEYVKFILTQSNVIAQIEQQGKSLEKAETWFMDSLEPVFHGERQSLIFEGYNWYFTNRKEK